MATHCVDYSVLWCLGSLGVCTSCALMKCVHLLIVLIDHITILIWTTNSPTTILIDLITTLIWTTSNHMHREDDVTWYDGLHLYNNMLAS